MKDKDKQKFNSKMCISYFDEKRIFFPQTLKLAQYRKINRENLILSIFTFHS